MKKNKLLLLILLILCLTLVSCKENTPDNPGGNQDNPQDKPVRPHTHSYGDWEILTTATLFNTGERVKKCGSCSDEIKETYYYFDEVDFSDKTYQYSGEEKKLLIEGLLPKGIRVEYKNNTLTKVGSVISTANFLNDANEIVKTETATLRVIEYRGLPEINIDTNNMPILNKEDYVASKITVSNCDDEYKLNEVLAGVRLRGNGSLEAVKKPYRIKFEKKQNLLGLNDNLKAKSWVLLADYYDYSMLRNASAFYLGNSLLNYADYYSSSYQHVNLYINGIYNGVYLLAEQQQVNEGRVDILEPEEDNLDINIGYLLELDSYAVNEGDYITLNLSNLSTKDYNGNNVPLSSMSYAIKSDYFSEAQKKHIEKYLNNVFKIMHSAISENKYYKLNETYDLVEADFTDAYQTINNVINLDSLFRVYILQELMKNIDVGFSSFYMFVDFSNDSKYTRLTFGAPWDFDWSSGNVNGHPYYASTGKFNHSNFNHSNPWLLTISNANFFEAMIKDYYEIFDNSNVFENLVYNLDEISSTYAYDFEKNYAKWKTLGTQQHVYSTSDVLNFKTQKDAKNFFKNWLTNRNEYLRSIWGKGE